MVDVEVVYDQKKMITKRLIDSVNSLGQMVNTIVVESSNGVIRSIKTIKDKNTVRNIEDNIEYSLKRHRVQTKSINSKLMTISDMPGEDTVCTGENVYDCLCYDIVDMFISELKDICKIKHSKFNYFNRNKIYNLFFKSDPNKLVDRIISFSGNSSWIIVPGFIFDIIKKSDRFCEYPKTNSVIKCLGKLGEISVYLNPSNKEGTIYFGNYDSLTIIINKNIGFSLDEFSQNKNGSIIVDYLFLQNGDVRSLIIT